jgi:hypothetical protein
MAVKSSSRRWIVLGLVALGVIVAATWPRGGPDKAEEPLSDPTEFRVAAPVQDREQREGLDGGMASRRVAEGCDPVSEALKYEEFVGRRALAILSWNGMSEKAANLEIPLHVAGIEDGALGVRFMQIPMRAQYVGIWLGSEHIRAGEKDLFLLDPCSATIIEWTAMERGTATEGEEETDEDAFLEDE